MGMNQGHGNHAVKRDWKTMMTAAAAPPASTVTPKAVCYTESTPTPNHLDASTDCGDHENALGNDSSKHTSAEGPNASSGCAGDDGISISEEEDEDEDVCGGAFPDCHHRSRWMASFLFSSAASPDCRLGSLLQRELRWRHASATDKDDEAEEGSSEVYGALSRGSAARPGQFDNAVQDDTADDVVLEFQNDPSESRSVFDDAEES
jgi:hypothetical protein